MTSPLAVMLWTLAIIMAVYSVAPVLVGIIWGLGTAVQIAGAALFGRSD